MKFLICLLFFVTMQSCAPVLVYRALKDSKKMEQEASSILSDNNLYLQYVDGSGQQESSIYSKDGRELVFLIRHRYHFGEDHGSVTYFTVVFLESQTKIRIERFSVSAVILFLNQSRLFEFGDLNEQAINDLKLKYG